MNRLRCCDPTQTNPRLLILSFYVPFVDNIEVGGEKAVVVIDWLGGEEIRRSNLYSTRNSRMSMAAHTR
jgi:hypothetical protein